MSDGRRKFGRTRRPVDVQNVMAERGLQKMTGTADYNGADKAKCVLGCRKFVSA